MRRFRPSFEVRLLAVALLVLAALLTLGGCGGGAGEVATWSTVVVDGTTLRFQATGVPGTAIYGSLLASGVREDPAVLTTVAQVTGRTREQATELLSSYDTSGSHSLQVLQLRYPTYVTRYWGDPEHKLGRWYTPSQQDYMYLPDEACRLFALPLDNNAYCVSLYRLKAGVVLITGYCADMTWNTEVFGPYATGGGQQIYVPEATVWAGDHAELNDDAIDLVSELRYPAGAAL
ncbi:MAG: hypothetical protein ABFE08_21140 [Armatimonadia bacterium]